MPDKACTKISKDKAQRGFNFLGCGVTPAHINPSAQNVSRREENIAQLYKQDTNKKFIGQ